MSTLLCEKLIMKWNWCIFENQIVNCVDSHPIRAGNNSKNMYLNHFQKYLLGKTYFQYYLSLNSVNHLGLSNAILAFLRWYFLVK